MKTRVSLKYLVTTWRLPPQGPTQVPHPRAPHKGPGSRVPPQDPGSTLLVCQINLSVAFQ